jgi:DNA-binding beta-propeller fold protein YncE
MFHLLRILILLLILCTHGEASHKLVAVFENLEPNIENVVFSPKGDCLAMLNGSSISFHRREGNTYCMTPYSELTGKLSRLNTPCDLAFSPDGNHLAVANRGSDTVTIYKKGRGASFLQTPIAVITGKHIPFNGIGGVVYLPDQRHLAIANTYDNSIAFCRYAADSYALEPSAVLETPELLLPESLCVDKGSGTLITLCQEKGTLVCYSLTRLQDALHPPKPGRIAVAPCQVVDLLSENHAYPNKIALDPITGTLAFTNWNENKVCFIQNGKKIDFGKAPFLRVDTITGISYSTDGSVLAVCTCDKKQRGQTFFFANQ